MFAGAAKGEGRWRSAAGIEAGEERVEGSDQRRHGEAAEMGGGVGAFGFVEGVVSSGSGR